MNDTKKTLGEVLIQHAPEIKEWYNGLSKIEKPIAKIMIKKIAAPEYHGMIDGFLGGDVEALQGAIQHDEEAQPEITDVPEEDVKYLPETPRSALELNDEEYETIMKYAYDKKTQRGWLDAEISEGVFNEFNVEISPNKIKSSLAFYSQKLESNEYHEEEKPQQKPAVNTKIFQDLLNKKNEAELKLKELENKKNEIGLIRKFKRWIY